MYKVTPYYKNPLAFTREINQVIRKNHYRIVPSNMNTLSAFPLFAAWLAGVPVRILHNHSTSSPGETKRNIMKYILRPFARLFANRYLACSQLAAVWMYGKDLADSGKVTVINNAIDLSKYAFHQEKRKTLRKALGLGDKFVIGHVGRFVFPKNHVFLLDAFAAALKKKPHMVLLLIGDGQLRPKMEEKAQQLGIGAQVIFLGLRSDVQDLYNAMDLFVLPSHYEGLPVVGVEAQANGLSCLFSTAVTRETKLTKNAVFFDLSQGAERWAEKIVSCTGERNMEVEQEMREAGFDIDASALKLEHMYEQMSTEGGHDSCVSTHSGPCAGESVWVTCLLPEWEACA